MNKPHTPSQNNYDEDVEIEEDTSIKFILD